MSPLADIRVGNSRHILYYLEDQLAVLDRANTWYLDSTFKITKRPFQQLFSVHAFVKGDSGQQKQVPLAFFMMSSRTKRDYKKVLKRLKKTLPSSGSRVEEMVVDFESGMWSAIRLVFPEVHVRGCLFHWNQAVWRHCQQFGLVIPFNTDVSFRQYIKKLMALPFLPHEHIPRAFYKLQERTNSPPLIQLCEYIESTWIISTKWAPSSWTVFLQSTRTNNDVEGWHRRINFKAGRHGLHFYKLVHLLHREASLVSVQMKLIKESKLAR
ncbi:uncharacterized protein LOC119722206 [Patiria miniata]|uniref:MULE transposase domain-containing protein n=1 Tax=Patiria miniata TaxID=46514 RepID=A0A913Z957_PATMI|nr:uncharacterized protein LOC119722206 [Patiria miniata]